MALAASASLISRVFSPRDAPDIAPSGLTDDEKGTVRYLHTDFVAHDGMSIAVALRSDRRFEYNILSLQGASVADKPLDKCFWQSPSHYYRELRFPSEIAYAGAGAADPLLVPRQNSSRMPVRTLSESDSFLSTTARLTNPNTPFRLLSDDRFLYLFRSSVSENDPNNFSVSDSISNNPYVSPDALYDAENAPVVDCSVLLDRFILSSVVVPGSPPDSSSAQIAYELLPAREVRYQRSRSKTRPFDSKDTLDAVDMEGVPFLESTLELSFLGEVAPGLFDAAILPTAIPRVSRWQFFCVARDKLDFLESVNVERSSDGLFNTQGSSITSMKDGHAESALQFTSPNQSFILSGQDATIYLMDQFTIEVWIKPKRVSHEDDVEGGSVLGGFNISDADSGVQRTINAPPTLWVANGTDLRVGWGNGSYFVETRFSGELEYEAWNHVAVVFLNQTSSNTGTSSASVKPLHVYITNSRHSKTVTKDRPDVVFDKDLQKFSSPDYLKWGTRDFSGASTDSRISCIGGNSPMEGTLDEVRLWSTARSERLIEENKYARLSGREWGLECYYRMDEASGWTIHNSSSRNLSSNAIHRTLSPDQASQPQWVTSDAPVGVRSGLYRDTMKLVSVDDSDAEITVVDGISALLYYSQEESSTSGYSSESKPTKTAARVMVAMPLQSTAAQSNPLTRMAVLDFSVRRLGRAAQAPTVVNLQTLQQAQSIQSDADLELPMKMIAIDPAGSTLTGGIVPSSEGCGPPMLFNSAVGNIALHFSQNNTLRVARYQTLTERATFRVTTSQADDENVIVLGAVSNAPEYDTIKIDIRPVSDDGATDASYLDDLCDVEITGPTVEEGSDPVKEVWRNVPRNATMFQDVLAGRATGSQYLGLAQIERSESEVIALKFPNGLLKNVQAGAALAFAAETSGVGVVEGARFVAAATYYKTDIPVYVRVRGGTNKSGTDESGNEVFMLEYDYFSNASSSQVPSNLSNGSLLVKPLDQSSVEEDSRVAIQFINGAQTFSSGWKRPEWRRALSFPLNAESSAALTGPNADYATPTRDLTLEFWTRVNDTMARGSLVSHSSSVGGTSYGVRLADTAVTCFAGPVSANFSLPSESLGDWAHFSMTYKRRYGILIGSPDKEAEEEQIPYIDCGNDDSMDIAGDMTIVTSLTFPEDFKEQDGTIFLLQRGFEPNSTEDAPYGLALHTKEGRDEFFLTFQWRSNKKLITATSGVFITSSSLNPGNRSVVISVTRQAQELNRFLDWSTYEKSGQDDDSLSFDSELKSDADMSRRAWRIRFAVLLASHTLNGLSVGRRNIPDSKLDDVPDIVLPGELSNGQDVYLAMPPDVDGLPSQLFAMYHLQGNDVKRDYATNIDYDSDSAEYSITYLSGRYNQTQEEKDVTKDEFHKNDDHLYPILFMGENVDEPRVSREDAKTKIGIGSYGAEQQTGVSLVINYMRVWSKSLDPVQYWYSYKQDDSGPINDGQRFKDLFVADYAANLVEDSLAQESLTGWWEFDEGEFSTSQETRGSSTAVLQNDARWKPADDSRDFLQILWNGEKISVALSDSVASSATLDSSLVLGNDAEGQDQLSGCDLGEVRLWGVALSYEQVVDRMFGFVDEEGDRPDILFYYNMQLGSQEFLPDSSGRQFAGSAGDDPQGALTLKATTATALSYTDSGSAIPVGLDTPLLGNARLHSLDALSDSSLVETKAISSSSIGVTEYADLQGLFGDYTSVLKRAYCYIRDDYSWVLVTSFFAGKLITEWVGQVQYDPTLIGYIEGAPPVPSENLTGTGYVLQEFGDYQGASSVQMRRTTNVRYSHGYEEASTEVQEHSLAVGFATQTKVNVGALFASERLVDFEGTAQYTFNKEFTEEEGESKSNSMAFETTSLAGAKLRGYVENDDDESKRNYLSVGRRYVPENVGTAVVKSRTADLFALRLRNRERSLVSTRTVPNAGIPEDLNVINFPINPSYQQQGSLDGKIADYTVSRLAEGKSYMKPEEAYQLQKSIRDAEQARKSAYINARAKVSRVGQKKGSKEKDLPNDIGEFDEAFPPSVWKKDIVNTYVWSADSGLAIAETSGGVESLTESFSGANSTTTAHGAHADGKFVAKIGFAYEYDFRLGETTSFELVSTQEGENAFELEVDLSGVEGDVYARDENGRIIIDEFTGKMTRQPFKVDAYRFMTFWLSPRSSSFNAFFDSVVDPTWLSTSPTANARLLKQIQSEGATSPPEVYRVLHRVTFVSRVFGDTDAGDAGDSLSVSSELDAALQEAAIESNFELVKLVENYIAPGNTESYEVFVKAVHAALAAQAKELAPYAGRIAEVLASYFGVSTESIDSEDTSLPPAPTVEIDGRNTRHIGLGAKIDLVGRFSNREVDDRNIELNITGPDDNPYLPQGYLVQWEVVSFQDRAGLETLSPDGAIEEVSQEFPNPGETKISYSFSKMGTYTVNLVLTDAKHEIKDSISLVVYRPPVVIADRHSPLRVLPESEWRYLLSGAVTDNGIGNALPEVADVDGFTLRWEQIAGPGEVAFDTGDHPQTLASFTEPGRYLLHLNAGNLVYSSGAGHDLPVGVGDPSTVGLEALYEFWDLVSGSAHYVVPDKSTARMPTKTPAPAFEFDASSEVSVEAEGNGLMLLNPSVAPKTSIMEIHPILKSNQFSIEVLVKLSSLQTDGVEGQTATDVPVPIVGLFPHREATSRPNFALGQIFGDNLYFEVRTEGTEARWSNELSSDVAVGGAPADQKDDGLIHIIGTWEASRSILYLNGAERARRLPLPSKDSEEHGRLNWEQDAVLMLGPRVSAQSWSGVVSFVRIYSRALTAEEVCTNYRKASLAERNAWTIRAGDDVAVVLEASSQSGQLESTVNLMAEWGPEVADQSPNEDKVDWSFLTTQPENFSSQGLSLTATFTQVGLYVAQVKYTDENNVDHKDWLTVVVNSDPQISLQESATYTLLAQESEERGTVGEAGRLSFVLPEPILITSGNGTRADDVSALDGFSTWSITNQPLESTVSFNDEHSVTNAQISVDMAGVYEFRLEARNGQPGTGPVILQFKVYVTAKSRIEAPEVYKVNVDEEVLLGGPDKFLFVDGQFAPGDEKKTESSFVLSLREEDAVVEDSPDLASLKVEPWTKSLEPFKYLDLDPGDPQHAQRVKFNIIGHYDCIWNVITLNDKGTDPITTSKSFEVLVNRAPKITAGSDLAVEAKKRLVVPLRGWIMDDGLPDGTAVRTYEWQVHSKSDPRIYVFFVEQGYRRNQSNQLSTSATVRLPNYLQRAQGTELGSVTFRLTVSEDKGDGQQQPQTDDVTVTFQRGSPYGGFFYRLFNNL